MYSVPGVGRPATTSRGWRSTPRATTTAMLQRRHLSDAERRRLGCVGDEHRLSLSRPAVGGVQRAVYAGGTGDGNRGRTRPAIGSVDGLGTDAATMHAMDGSITDDPRPTPAAGSTGCAFPRARAIAFRSRFGTGTFARTQRRPGYPPSLAAEPVADSKHSHQWARLRFNVPPSGLPIAKYEVRIQRRRTIIHRRSPRPSSGASPAWPPARRRKP